MKRFVVILFGIFLSAISYADTCTQSQIDLGNGECIESKFEITTVNMPADTIFKFKMSAAGVFYVDWGDGTVQTIDRTGNRTETQYTHTYLIGGVNTIRFAGLATEYNSDYQKSSIRFGNAKGYGSMQIEDYTNTPTLIASVTGSLGTIFPGKPSMLALFYGATNLTSIPSTLFQGMTGGRVYMFYGAFYNCEKLVEIPNGLFDGIKVASGIYSKTFQDCSKLTSIPENLFKDITGTTGEVFYYTFSGCTSLQSIPAGLFSNITEGAQYLFTGTFYNCPNLSGYIPPSAFAGLIANGSPTVSNMWTNVFSGTQLDKTCPTGTTQYITGYEDYWGGRVSCVEDTPHVCSAGEYLPKLYNSCAVCPGGKYCTGGTFNFSSSADQGLSGNITAGYFSSGGGISATPTSSDCLSGYICGTCRGQTGPNGRPLYTSAAGGASACDECPAVSGEFASRATGNHGYYPSSRDRGIMGCLATFNDADDDATFWALCYYNTAYNNYETGQCHIYEPTACAAGRYNTIRQNTEWRRYGDDAAGCTGVDCMNGKVCTATDPGYYSPDGATTQTPCASGTYSPSGSAVCYPHILHIGDNNVYLKSTKQTMPSLNIKIGDDIFYAHMTTVPTKINKDSTRYFRVQWPNNDYYICDDTTCPQ